MYDKLREFYNKWSCAGRMWKKAVRAGIEAVYPLKML